MIEAKVAAIIVAAGEGRRMGGPVRKQYLPLEGIPVVARTVRAFEDLNIFRQILVVVPEGDREYCQEIIRPHCRLDLLQLIEGGAARQDSVFMGLKEIGAEIEMVCIHDGVRPLVSKELIISILEGAARYGAAIPGIGVTDTLKELNANETVRSTVSRDKFRLVQTPQAFQRGIILEAYRQAFLLGVEATDDSYLLERLDIGVKVLPGEPHNIKITGPHDLLVASAYLKGGY